MSNNDANEYDNLTNEESIAISLSAPRSSPNNLLSLSTIGDRVTRTISSYLPLTWQNEFRDSGGFRALSDGIVSATAPLMALKSPELVKKYMDLSRKMNVCRYGEDPRQEIHLYLPSQNSQNKNSSITGFLFFVHGGAWGSGLPWMYRLLALSFLDIGMAVAIVGYRTYPDADVSEQIKDLSSALNVLLSTKPFLFRPPSAKYTGACIMGHSSGAHVALLLLSHLIKTRMSCSKGTIPFHSFIGLSGPYCINSHFDYEAHRGVEQISPLKAACGHSLNNFLLNSPHIQLYHFLSEHPDQVSYVPRLLFVHGMQDSTVPFTATADAAQLLRSCAVKNIHELYLANVNHTDAILHFMTGGKTCDKVLHWLLNYDESYTDICLDGISSL